MKTQAVKHTPGEWKYVPERMGIVNKDGLDICTVLTNGDDARLIAAAPDLLEALKVNAIRFPIEFKTTMNSCTCNQFIDNEACRHVMALQVIAKAEPQETEDEIERARRLVG